MTNNPKMPELRFPEFSGDWEEKKIGEVFKERNERGRDDLELLSVTLNNGVIKRTDIDAKDNSSKDKSTYKVVEVNDIAYNSMRMWQGASGVSRFKGIVSPAYTILIPKKDIDSNFFGYMFKTEVLINEFRKNSQGLTSDTWNLKYPLIKQISISMPSHKEQKKISELFFLIDKKTEKQEKKIASIEDYKRGMMQKLFPKKGENVPELRFKGFTDPWEQRKLGELSDSFEYGLNAAATEYDGENKYIRITDIDDESRRFVETNLTSPKIDLSNAGNYKLKIGDILFARTGASVGKSYIYNESDGLVYYAGFLIRTRIKPEYDAEFVFQSTLTSKYNDYIRITSQRSGQPGVNAQEYAEFTFLIPELDEQFKIGTFFRNLDNLITLHQHKLEELKELKKGFMQKMFI